MSKISNIIARRKKGLNALNTICQQNDSSLIIHYSCESFKDLPNGRTPRITSVAVRYLNNAQTRSFSIHKVAEEKRIPFNDILNNYDTLEKQMLDDFFQFLVDHKNYKWIHWNMRDINFGFDALNHRYRVLGGQPTEISDTNKFDLARILSDIFGVGYIGHPRFQKLLELNNITMINFLTGEEEAAAFNSQEYVKLHQSTLRKVESFQSVIQRANEGELKTKSRWYNRYGITPQSLFELSRERIVASVIYSIIIILLGIVIRNLVCNSNPIPK